MTPRFVTINEKKLVGKKLTMSMANNQTRELWTGFMPRRKEINNQLTSDLFSVQEYGPDYFTNPKLTNEFVKWVAVEVSNLDNVPNDMETFILTGGLYAVFQYKGSSTDTNIYYYIFGTWLPDSGYKLDHRPHFEIMGYKYKNADPDSEEEIWIPVQKH
jgi:AraC family transcriptional regulator